ncbi:AHH domain-containing protein [Hyalangium versicolor]|uniref:AHH domain-containing protein n=1 Tax=Hyalangium versicolor TaxID=2861190 RepID=UPI001CCA5D56|nr:AHH domain-containing protein [Hyalangium versicolor]
MADKDPSQEQHLKDVASAFHEENANTPAGKCLNRHVSVWKELSCSHRWQAYLRATEDHSLYNWPKYRRFTRENQQLRTDAKKDYITTSKGVQTVYPIYPTFYREFLDAPKQFDWDVEQTGNFKYSCVVPYYHNAHHIVTNSELRNAINDLTKKFESRVPDANALVRGGLLKAGYNINHKINMIILPMDKVVADELRLPRHLEEVTRKSHPKYSSQIKNRLGEIMNDYASVLDQVAQAGQDHVMPNYALYKTKLETLSTDIYSQITSSTRSPDYDGTVNTVLNPKSTPKTSTPRILGKGKR